MSPAMEGLQVTWRPAPSMRFSHQESVPVEGRDRRRWPSLQRVVRDFERGPSEQDPAKRHSALRRLTALTCRDASLARPWTANPGKKTSIVFCGRDSASFPGHLDAG